MTARGRRRAQRLAVLALVVGLTLTALATRPGRHEEGPPRPATGPAPRPEIVTAAAAPGARAAATPWPAAEATADADAVPPTAAPEPDAEPWRSPAVGPAGPAGPDIVVALDHPGPPVPSRVTYVHATESAQPVPVPALPVPGGAAGSLDASAAPEPGALYWFGPEGLVRLLAREEPR